MADTTFFRIQQLEQFLNHINYFADHEKEIYELFDIVEQQYFTECMADFPDPDVFCLDLESVLKDYMHPYLQFKGRRPFELYPELYAKLIDALRKAVKDEIHRTLSS